MTTTGLLGLMGLVCLCAFARAEGEDQNTGHVSHHWTYAGDADGTDPWTQTYANCAGKKQSPINIEPKNAIYVPLLHDVPLELIGYENPLTGIGVYLTNNGHTVVAGIGDHSKHDIGISGAALSHYTLAQMHWHWGSVNWRGSEHTVRGVSYAMEMHLVHINKRYVDNDTAIHASPKGLAVLGVFIEVGAHNPAFNEIVKYLANTSRQDAGDKTVPITIPTLRQFLPADLSKFFRYSGSLTTPPCSEAVIWTVFKQPIQISQEQLDAFRTKLVKDKSPNRTPSKSNLIADNFRPVLPLNDRRLYVSYDTAGIVEVPGSMIHNWGYYGSTHGPAPTDWHTRFKVCGGKKQSPIHIKHATAQYSPELSTSPWRLHNYDKLPGNTKTILQNNGHTVVVKTGDGVSVSGGGLPGDYKLLQFHLHWGSHNANGSEHLLDNKQYPAEIHLVHSNMYYGKGTDTDAIMANNDGLAVLGIFVEVGDYNPDFDPIIQQISKVEYMSDEDHVDLKLTSIRHLLPDDMSEFYRYSGSLTTPPCSEIVVWTVFKNPIRISQEQLNMFRTEIYSNAKPNATSSEAHDDDAPDKTTPAHGAASGDHGAGAARHIVDNFRPLQELGYRVVKYAKIDMNLLSAGVRVGHSVCVMLAVVCVTILKVLL